MWRARLEQEYDNLRSALTWWLERAQQPDGQQAAEYALRLCNGLFLFWGSSGLLQEGRDFMERALRVRMGVDETVQAKALARAAEVLTTLGTPEPGEALAQESLALARKVGNPDEIARALRILGEGAALREAYEQARLYFEEAAALEQQTGNVWMRVINLFSLATIARRQGHYERAYALLEECVALSQTLGDPWQLGWMLTQLGWTHLVAQGDLSRAASLAEQGLALVRGVGNRLYYARVLGMLGEIRRQQGKLDEARMLLEEGLAFFKEKALQNGVFEFQMSLARLLAQQGQVMEAQALYYENRALLPAAGQKLLIAEYLEGWGVVLATLGAPERAARLWGAAEVLREAIDSPMFPIYREEYAQAVTTARTRLRNDAFVAAWNEGRAMTPAQALDAAADQEMLAHPREGIPRKTPVSPGGPEGLTPREVEVLRLLAQGLTNAQIAERLVVSPLTVHTHLGSIYSKLGVTSRSGATR